MAFRISFNPEWFLAVFEKCALRNNQTALSNQSARGDPATHCLTLRFLALMIQSDGIFLKEFCAKDGMKYLRSLLLHHIDLADVIILLGMFFGIPMHLLPLPCQLYVVPAESSDNRKDKDKAVTPTASTAKKDSRAGNLTVLLTLRECLGVDLSEGGMRDFSLPLLEILLDCLPAANDITDQTTGTQGPGSDPNEIQSKVRDTILSTLSQAYYTLRSFRRLLQQKGALQAVVTTLLFFSDVNTVPIGVNHPPIRSDLELREDYFSAIVSSSTFSSVATTPAKGERTPNRPRIDVASSSATTETNNSGNSSSPSGSSSVADERSLFRASANWDNLFAQKATPPKPPLHPVQPQPLAPTVGPNLDPEIAFTAEGKTLLQLVSSVISSAITEFENASVLCALLLSLPSGTSEESLQLLVVRCFRDVVDDVFSNFFDQNSSKKSKNILLVLSAVFNHLTPFFRSKLFTPLANFEILKLSLSVLVRCYDFYSSDVSRPNSVDRLGSLSGESTEKDISLSREKENDRDKERRERSKVSALLIAKDIGRSGRYFACSCLQAVEAGEMKSARERSMPFRGELNVSCLTPHVCAMSAVLLLMCVQCQLSYSSCVCNVRCVTPHVCAMSAVLLLICVQCQLLTPHVCAMSAVLLLMCVQCQLSYSSCVCNVSCLTPHLCETEHFSVRLSSINQLPLYFTIRNSCHLKLSFQRTAIKLSWKQPGHRLY
jgi:hypothetical protein